MMITHESALSRAAAPLSMPVNFAGRWRNQYGSEMDLHVSGRNLSGRYTSAVSSGGGPVTGDLSGFVNGDLISFVVNWPAAAITAWVGQLVNADGYDIIQTLWNMTTNIPDANEPTGMWQSILAGADRFHR